jgi:ABC-type branched-subunit amino acid transport system ATPase component
MYANSMMLNTEKDASADQKVVPNNSQTPVLLRAKGLKMAFGGHVVLNSVDLELRQGEVVLLRGENGSGKTTLLNILTGCLEADAGTIHYLVDSTPRTFNFPCRWWQGLNPFDHFTPESVAREGIGRTWQDIRLFGSQSLRDNIAVAQPNHPGENPIFAVFTPNRSARRDVEFGHDSDVILSKLGLAGRETSSADKVSLGQSKRVAIARAVAAGARVLFLDEPLAGLDRQGIADVLVLLETLVDERKITLVIVEHVSNQAYLHDLVTTHWLLEKGKLQRSDKKPRLTVDQGLSTNVSKVYPAWLHLLAGDSAEIVEEPLPHGAILLRIRRPDRFKIPAKPVLEIRDLVVSRGKRPVIGLDNDDRPVGLNLTVYEGEIDILQAPNGWGKSTLFGAIMGLIQSESGMIRAGTKPIDGLPTWERVQSGLCALPSHDFTFSSLLAKEVLQLAGNVGEAGAVDLLAEKTCSSLSGGQKKRLAFRSITNPRVAEPILLLDEPFAALDAIGCEKAVTTIFNENVRATLLLEPTFTRSIDEELGS